MALAQLGSYTTLVKQVTDELFPNTERARKLREIRSISSSFTKVVYEPHLVYKKHATLDS